MAKYRHYRCPDCDGTFKHLHVLSDEPPPDRCALCGNWMNVDEAPPDEVFVPTAPGIKKSAYAKSVDQTYRAYEDASIQRAQEAADLAGVPVSEMSGLKVTNLRDPSEMRQGDLAAILPAAVQNLSVAGGPGFQSGEGGVAPDRSGMGIATDVRSSHAPRALAMTRAGQMGSYRDSK